MAPFLATMVSHEATSSALGSPATLPVKAALEHDSGSESQPEVVIDNSAPPVAVSSGSSEELFCRICHEGGGAEQLLSLCKCSGSLALVHRNCMERWLTASSTGRCELCRFEFALERQPRPLTEWLHAPSMRYQRRTLCGDALCFTFITPLASLSGWLCIRGAMDLYHSNSMEAAGLLVLTVALLAIYLFWTTVSGIRLPMNMVLFRKQWDAELLCNWVQIETQTDILPSEQFSLNVIFLAANHLRVGGSKLVLQPNMGMMNIFATMVLKKGRNRALMI